MSVSTLSELETCPRRWALSTAEYPQIWERTGYPRPLQLSALEGTVVHFSLQRITEAFVERGCLTLHDELAIGTLRELGGFTEVIRGSVDRALKAYEGNPRAAPRIQQVRDRLICRVPTLRSRIQRFLSGVHWESHAPRRANLVAKRDTRQALQYGPHTEVELRAAALGWGGVADLLTLSAAACEVRDFKTGAWKEAHELQVRIYALLWWRDTDLNRAGRLANRLVLSYEDGDVEVPAPGEAELEALENKLKNRTAAVLAELSEDPPEARPSQDNCQFCAVRHLCEEYWRWPGRRGGDAESLKDAFADIQVKLVSRHGQSSWDAVIESQEESTAGKAVLLRTAGVRCDLRAAQRLRLLGVHLSTPRDGVSGEEPSMLVATMGEMSEAFVLAVDNSRQAVR